MRTSVLLVDDHAEARASIAARLRQSFGFEVIEAASVAEAAARFADGARFELVVCDDASARGSGLALFHSVQRDSEVDAHFILFTDTSAHATDVDRGQVIVIDKRRVDELLDTIQFLGLAAEGF